MRIREMEMDRDLADYARLRAIADDWNLTPEQILERLAKSGDRLTTRAFVAEVDGRVVGFSRWARFAHEKPGIAQVMLAVEPDHERAGIGTALFEQIEENLNEHKLDKPWGFAREDRARGIRFAQVNGYREKRRYFDSVADLTAFDPANATVARSHLESLGLTICRFEIASGQHPELPALYDLYAEADADEPSTQVVGVPSFEHYASFFEISENQRGVVYAVAADGAYVAMSNTSIDNQDHVWNEFTGTRRAWRGKGVAGALKTLVLAEHAARGDREMHTSNNSENAPMLAINRRLGFQPRPAWLILEREDNNR